MYLSLAANVTDNDFEQLNNVSSQIRATIIFAYLVGEENGKTYNFNDIAKLTGKSTGQAFSSICRCYNIGEKSHRSNSGIYSVNSAFSRKYNYKVTKEDIIEFVSKYPNGCYPKVNLEDYLIEKINANRMKILHKQELLREQEENNRIREKLRLQEENKRLKEEEAYKKKKEQQQIAIREQQAREVELTDKWIESKYNSHKILKIGDEIEINSIIKFGGFFEDQEDEVTKKLKNLPWIILDMDDDKMLLLSCFIIKDIAFDDKFNSVDSSDILTLHNCSIYKWLNDYFYNIAFSKVEKENIISLKVNNDLNLRSIAWNVLDKAKLLMKKDDSDFIDQKVFILSYDELKKYSGNDYNNLPSGCTGLCVFDSDRIPSYWTRTASNIDKSSLVTVSITGSVSGAEEINKYIPSNVLRANLFAKPNDNASVGVRPALWVKKEYFTNSFNKQNVVKN